MSPIYDQLQPKVAGRAEYFILKLRYPENAQSEDLVYIDEILQPNWVRVYEPGDIHFDER